MTDQTDFQRAREAAVQAIIKQQGPLVASPERLADPVWRTRQEERRYDAVVGFVDAALSAFSAAGWELVQKGDGWVRVPIEVENACLNWLANRLQGNSHGEDVELGRLMRGLQTYIKAVANGTNK